MVVAAQIWGGREDRDGWESQWAAIETIASDLWATPEDDADAMRRLWVNLVYAIGNFKRQGNTGIMALPGPWRLTPVAERGAPRAELRIPTDGEPLVLTASGTTARLRGLTRGLASTPTGSTLLAALWPKEHAILDIRDFRVAVALLSHRGAAIVPSEPVSLYRPGWAEYLWFRAMMKVESARLGLPSMLVLERALFTAHEFGRSSWMKATTWYERGELLRTLWPATTDANLSPAAASLKESRRNGSV